MEVKAFEPNAVVVAVPPFAIGMTPVREKVVVEFPPEVETVDVMFPVPMSWKLIAPEVPLKVETKAVEDERYCVEAVYAAEPKPREEEEKVRDAEVVVVETEMKGFVDVTL